MATLCVVSPPVPYIPLLLRTDVRSLELEVAEDTSLHAYSVQDSASVTSRFVHNFLYVSVTCTYTTVYNQHTWGTSVQSLGSGAVAVTALITTQLTIPIGCRDR